MRQNDQTEVLVVGAGPVGMFTSLRLAERGVRVRLIDQEARTAGRSYACALHPRSLQLLDESGLAREAIEMGRRIETVAFYEGPERRAEVQLSRLPVKFPFVLVLQQSRLEDLLEKKLKQRGVDVHWNHRLADLKMKDGATATLEELAQTGKGYGAAKFETGVKKSAATHVQFVVGADGQNSAVRQHLDIATEQARESEHFTVCELETEEELPPEMRIVLSRQTTSVLWPFTENKCRWSFQWFEAEPPGDFPQKDRNRFAVAPSAGHKELRQLLEQMLCARAPWFRNRIKSLGWAAEVQFEPRLASSFGRDRAWLAGDAAHQTGPVGAQSMNVGLREGADLAARLALILRAEGSRDLLDSYNLERRAEWEQLLGSRGGPRSGAATGQWVREHSAYVPSCLPASGVDLTLLLRQLGLEFEYQNPRELEV